MGCGNTNTCVSFAITICHVSLYFLFFTEPGVGLGIGACCLTLENSSPGIYIHSLAPGSVAKMDGRLRLVKAETCWSGFTIKSIEILFSPIGWCSREEICTWEFTKKKTFMLRHSKVVLNAQETFFVLETAWSLRSGLFGWFFFLNSLYKKLSLIAPFEKGEQQEVQPHAFLWELQPETPDWEEICRTLLKAQSPETLLSRAGLNVPAAACAHGLGPYSQSGRIAAGWPAALCHGAGMCLARNYSQDSLVPTLD